MTKIFFSDKLKEMEEIMKEKSLLIWQRGPFENFLYSKTQNGDSATYTFYTDRRADGSKGKHEISASVTNPIDEPLRDKAIVDAFIDSLSEKIRKDVVAGSLEYYECMKTLPNKFYTQGTCDKIIENILVGSIQKSRKVVTPNDELRLRSDDACCKLMDVAKSKNPNVKKGNGNKHLGELE